MARRIPRDESLQRVHGVSALFATAYGNVGSSIYYALGVVAIFALGLTPLAFLVSGLIFVCTAATYTEATVMYPEAGGSSSFARHAFNEVLSFFAAWGQMLNYVITAAISAFFVPHYLAVFWEPLGHGPGDVIGGIVLIAALVALNVRGTEESARVNLVLAIADLATQVILVVIGMVLVLSPDTLVSNVDLGVTPTWGDFALGVAVGMVAYTGIETISNMAEEAKDASTTVPKGVGLVVAAVIGLYALLPIIALSAMPVVGEGAAATTTLATEFADDPILGIVENLGLSDGLTDGLRIYVGVLAAVILLIATNAGLIGLSRLTYSMGQYRHLPERIRKIHPEYRTPYVAIVLFGAIAALTLLPGETEFLATMYSFGAMLSFTVAHISVVRLRQRYPDADRPWKPPMNVTIRGVEVPVTALIGGLGTFSAWVVVISLNLSTLIAGTVWMVAGMALFIGYRRRHGLSLNDMVKVETLEPLGVEELEYQSILVGFDEGDFSEELVVTAVKLAARRRRGIHVAVLVTVPNDLPLKPLPERLAGPARNLIERAKLAGGTRRVSGELIEIRRGGGGRALVDLAKRIDARAIVYPLSRRHSGGPMYSQALETLLDERPCRVIVLSDPSRHAGPAAAPTGGGASGG